MKKKHQKEIAKNEFRKNKKNNHPSYIFARVGNDYKYLGLTHAEITDGIKNIKLDKNPNPKDSRPAFIKPKSEKSKTNNFKKKQREWVLSKKDKEKISKLKK